MSDQYGGSPEYPPMPPEPPPYSEVERGPAPASVISAVRLMFVRAALGLVGIIVVLATKDTLKEEILKNNQTADAARLDSLLNTALAIGVVVGLVFIVLYVLLALQVRAGKNWARVVTWVLAGLGAFFGLLSLAQPAPVFSRLISLVTIVLDIAIIVFLARRPSAEYFRSNR